MNVISLFFIGELMTGINYLTAVKLSVLNVLGSTHNGYVNLSATSYNVVPVDKVNVCEETEVQLAVLDGKRFASSKEAGAKVSVCVHAGVIAGLVYVSAVLSVDRTGVTVLMLLCKVGDHLSHNVEKVMLEILKVERIDVM